MRFAISSATLMALLMTGRWETVPSEGASATPDSATVRVCGVQDVGEKESGWLSAHGEIGREAPESLLNEYLVHPLRLLRCEE